MSIIASNPIIPGFFPDPSICSCGDDFYIVNSSFCYFPGLPILHSKDLANWEIIGNAMNRSSQLDVNGCELSEGLFAPTIRHYEGMFYIVCTNVKSGGNFVIEASNPEGPWSDPFYIEGAEGIDPSLFFDEDGKCYYIGTHENRSGAKYNGDWYIYIQEFDIKNKRLVGEFKEVWNGSQKNVIWPEGPHIFRENGYYYIMHAEGGTGPDHSEAICRSKSIWGPYENNPCNPIITHRHLGGDFPIRYVGHADMTKTTNGEYYIVLLGVRQSSGYTTIGRETFLARVTWESNWPIVNVGVGMLTDEVDINLEECKNSNNDIASLNKMFDFTAMVKLSPEFVFLRQEEGMRYSLSSQGLLLKFSKTSIMEDESATYLGLRQQHRQCIYEVNISGFALENSEVVGLALYQNSKYHLRLELSSNEARLLKSSNGQDSILEKCDIGKIESSSSITIRLEINKLKANFMLLIDSNVILCVSEIDIRELSTEVAGGFVGCTIGVFASNPMLTQDSETEGIIVKSISYQGMK